jgi:hypothetical protein
MINPSRNSSALKERIAAARAKLGSDKADAILAAALAVWKKDGGEFLTLRREVEVLEAEAKSQPKSSPLQSARLPAPVAVARPQTAIGAPDLCAQYDALTSDEQRRAFWNRHRHELSDPKGKIPGLAQICMAAAKPLSIRARFQLPATARAARAGELVMSKKDWLALEPFSRGQFKALGGKVVPETIKRSLFQQLAPRDQTEFCLNGGRVIN